MADTFFFQASHSTDDEWFVLPIKGSIKFFTKLGILKLLVVLEFQTESSFCILARNHFIYAVTFWLPLARYITPCLLCQYWDLVLRRHHCGMISMHLEKDRKDARSFPIATAPLDVSVRIKSHSLASTANFPISLDCWGKINHWNMTWEWKTKACDVEHTSEKVYMYMALWSFEKLKYLFLSGLIGYKFVCEAVVNLRCGWHFLTSLVGWHLWCYLIITQIFLSVESLMNF